MRAIISHDVRRGLALDTDPVVHDTIGKPAPARTAVKNGANDRLLFTKEEAQRLALAALFHEVTEAVATAMRPFLADRHVDTLREMARANFLHLVGRPLAIDASKISAFSHAEGFGTAEYRPIVMPPPRFAHPAALYRGFRQSFWYNGFIAGLDPATRTLITACRNLHRAMRRHA